MERCPSFIVSSINISSVGHQELHHVEVVINAGLGKMIQYKGQFYIGNSLKEGLNFEIQNKIISHFSSLHFEGLLINFPLTLSPTVNLVYPFAR